MQTDPNLALLLSPTYSWSSSRRRRVPATRSSTSLLMTFLGGTVSICGALSYTVAQQKCHVDDASVLRYRQLLLMYILGHSLNQWCLIWRCPKTLILIWGIKHKYFTHDLRMTGKRTKQQPMSPFSFISNQRQVLTQTKDVTSWKRLKRLTIYTSGN